MATSKWVNTPLSSSKWWHFDASGYRQTGWYLDTDGMYYCLNNGLFNDYAEGQMVRSKWIASGSKWYYVKASGIMAKSESILINGKIYNFASNGACLNP